MILCVGRCRGRALKAIESTPLQIAMCVLVLIDAAVVVAEILLDMHAIKSSYNHINRVYVCMYVFVLYHRFYRLTKQ